MPWRVGSSVAGAGTLINLQRGLNMRNSTIWDKPHGQVLGVIGDNTDLETMLAVMACLDEYIGVSNTNMHLRAAVGKWAASWCPIRLITNGWRLASLPGFRHSSVPPISRWRWGAPWRRFRPIWARQWLILALVEDARAYHLSGDMAALEMPFFLCFRAIHAMSRSSSPGNYGLSSWRI